MRRKKLIILLEDFEIMSKVSPYIVSILRKSFEVRFEKNRKYNYSIVVLTYRFSDVQSHFYSLIHSLHVVACDLYRKGDFSEYLVLDGFMFMLVKML